VQLRAAREAEAAAEAALSPQLAALEAQWELLHAVSGAADVEELLAMWQGALTWAPSPTIWCMKGL
jgi:hypothetical protein